MNPFKRRFLPRLTAAGLSLALLAAPAAQALTADQAGQLLQELYVDELPQSVLEQPTIEEMLEALGDPYTEYFTPEEYSAFTASMSDTSLVGIGVVFTITEEGLLLDQVLTDSPAEKSGLKAGDLILAVDGRSVLDQDSATITSWIQGKEGTKVKITYRRDDRERTSTLTRALVVVAATTSELLDDHIGYISCTTFGSETVSHFEEAIRAYGKQADVWIVDLRANLGGATNAATEAAGLFTGPGEMAYLRDSTGQYGVYYHEDAAATLYPVIVLVDQQSASASEIFASAIRDRNTGIVVGTRTFGKGVAQTVVDQSYRPEFFPDGDGLKITSHRFFSPEGNTTDQVGVIPDLLVSPAMVGDVAYLLAGSAPTEDSGETLRVDLDWRWHVSLEQASDPGFKPAFQALLNALPTTKKLWLTTGKPDSWKATTPAEIAKAYGLDYTAPVFPDQADSIYNTPISILKTYGMIHGKDDGLFHPQDTLTRAEFCQLTAVALNLTVPENDVPYSDVADDAWYAPAVTAMSNLGLVTGTGGDLFRPEEPMDHQQFITILGRLAQRLNFYLYNTVAELPEDALSHPGLSAYADWSKTSVWLMSYSQTGFFGNNLSLLWDTAENIDPSALTTRDEAAYALYSLLSFTGILHA